MIQQMLAIGSLVPLPSKSSLHIWKFTVHILLKPSLKDFEHILAGTWNEHSCTVVGTFFGIAKWTKIILLFSCHLLLDHIQFTLIYGPNIPNSYAILFFTALDFTFTTRHIHNWVSVECSRHMRIKMFPHISKWALGQQQPCPLSQ